MYVMTALDREPRTLFGKTYFWSLTDAGNLTLVSVERMTNAMRESLEASRRA